MPPLRAQVSSLSLHLPSTSLYPWIALRRGSLVVAVSSHSNQSSEVGTHSPETTPPQLRGDSKGTFENAPQFKHTMLNEHKGIPSTDIMGDVQPCVHIQETPSASHGSNTPPSHPPAKGTSLTAHLPTCRLAMGHGNMLTCLHIKSDSLR